MRRALAGLCVLGVLLGLQTFTASATTTGCSTVASGARTASDARTTCPTVDPEQVLYDQLRSRLGGDLARALTSQQRLATALDQSAASEEVLNAQIAQEEGKIAQIESQLAALDAQIADTQQRIDVEQAQVAAMARAIYRQPKSFFELIASAGSLREALVATSGLIISGERAHALQTQLESDLAALETQRTARLADLDHENTIHDSLETSLSSLDTLISNQNTITAQLSSLIARIRTAQQGLHNQPASVTDALTRLLEQEETIVLARAYQAAWSQAQVGAGVAFLNGELPANLSLSGLVLSWPLDSLVITQPFGPSSLPLEPALGQYAHFHTGIDIAAPLGSVVKAAADGVVVAVGHTSVGYGNYVVIAHGGGIMTLYGHLFKTDVSVGQRVMRGQRIGLEGATGLATGPHVHFELRVNNQFVNPMPYLPSPIISGT